VQRGGLPHVAGCPHELGVGVADIEPGEPAPAVLGEHRPPRQPVVDLADGAVGGAPDLVRPETHLTTCASVTAARLATRPPALTGDGLVGWIYRPDTSGRISPCWSWRSWASSRSR